MIDSCIVCRKNTTLLLCLVFISSLTSAVCLAQDASTRLRVKALTEEGQELQGHGAHLDAIKKFDEALSLLDHPFVKYCKAISLEALGRLEEARDLLREINGHEFVRDVQNDISARLTSLDRQLKPVPFKIRTRGVTGARVFMDGRFVGTTPVKLMATPGKRKVILRLEGYRTVREEVSVDPPGPVEREFELVEAQYGMLSLECDAPGADVFVDEEWVGTIPLKGPIKIEDGKHVVRVVRLGFGHQTVEVDIVADKTTAIAVSLKAIEAPRTPREAHPVAAKVLLAGGVASFATGLGFLIKYLVDMRGVSGGGEMERDGLRITVGADRLLHTNAIVGGVLMGTGLGLGIASYFLWPQKEDEQ